VEGPEEEAIYGLWIDIVLSTESGPVAPFVDGIPVSHTTTEWGIRVPIGDLPAGEGRLISLRIQPPQQ